MLGVEVSLSIHLPYFEEGLKDHPYTSDKDDRVEPTR